MERVKLEIIGQYHEREFHLFQSNIGRCQHAVDIYSALIEISDALTTRQSPNELLKYQIAITIGEGPASRDVQIEYTMLPHDHVASTEDVVNFDSLMTPEELKPKMLLLWLHGGYLIASDRPTRNPRDREHVCLKIEELVLEASQEFKKLREKVDRLRRITQGFTEERNRQRLSDDVLAYVLARDRERCVTCGTTEDLQFDHILPWSRGGGNTVDNLRVLCANCNLARGNLTN